MNRRMTQCLTIFATLLLVSTQAVAQTPKHLHGCDLQLNMVLVTNEFQDHFRICKESEGDVVLIDTLHFFVPGTSLVACNRKVAVQDDFILSNQSSQVLVLYEAICNQKGVQLRILDPASNAAICLNYKVKHRRFKLIKSEAGVF